MTAPEVHLAALRASLSAGVATSERLALVDLASLLAPIDESAPAGDWVRYEPIFDTLRETRREDDSSTPQGIWSRDLKRADWVGVHTLATDLLATRTKDLQIAAWLLEAWIRLHGFAGARVGFELLAALCSQYWKDLYPLPDGDDQTARTSTIEWVNERLPLRLLEVPVTKPTELDGRSYTWGDRTEALRRDALSKRAGKAAKATAAGPDELTPAKFASSAGSTPQALLVDWEDDLGGALAAARALESFLDEQCGNAAPSLSKIIGLMAEIRRYLNTVLDERGRPAASVAAAAPTPVKGQAAVPAADDSSSILDAVVQQTPTTQSAPVIMDHSAARTEAYRKLAEAVDTLMRIEPHSPTPYLVKRAIAWGGMSLAELMRHFIDSGYDLKSLYTMLGMGE
ncbi:MAG TPA: type VI secretion system protein TssA [Gemmatimonadaceae bacterium]|jgi:type VI secretion system ImpA family protein